MARRTDINRGLNEESRNCSTKRLRCFLAVVVRITDVSNAVFKSVRLYVDYVQAVEHLQMAFLSRPSWQVVWVSSTSSSYPSPPL